MIHTVWLYRSALPPSIAVSAQTHHAGTWGYVRLRLRQAQDVMHSSITASMRGAKIQMNCLCGQHALPSPHPSSSHISLQSVSSSQRRSRARLRHTTRLPPSTEETLPDSPPGRSASSMCASSALRHMRGSTSKQKSRKSAARRALGRGAVAPGYIGSKRRRAAKCGNRRDGAIMRERCCH